MHYELKVLLSNTAVAAYKMAFSPHCSAHLQVERSHTLSGTCYAHWLEARMAGDAGGRGGPGELTVRPPEALYPLDCCCYCYGLDCTILHLQKMKIL